MCGCHTHGIRRASEKATIRARWVWRKAIASRSAREFRALSMADGCKGILKERKAFYTLSSLPSPQACDRVFSRSFPLHDFPSTQGAKKDMHVQVNMPGARFSVRLIAIPCFAVIGFVASFCTAQAQQAPSACPPATATKNV